MDNQLLQHYYIISGEQMATINDAADRLQETIVRQYNAGKMSIHDYVIAIANIHSISRQQYHSLQYKEVNDEANKSSIG